MQYNMNSIIYLACLLAPYLAASSATQVERRGFGGYVSSQQERQHQSAASRSSYAGGVGGFGGLGYGSGSNQYNQESSSSYSSSSVINSFSQIGAQISQMQNLIGSSSLSQQVAYQHMSQLASSFQYALSQAPHCGSCFGQSEFSSSVSSVFQQFTQLMSSMQSSYGGAFTSICAPFSQLENSFQSFFQSASSNGLSLNTLIPQPLASLLDPVIPGFGAALSGFGYSSSHQEQYQHSSASRSSYGGGVGGFGGFGSSSQYSQESSSSYSSSTVINSFSNIGSQISQMQSLIASSSMTQEVAYQQMSQLASSFQFALSQAPHCGSCFEQGGFSSTVSSVFQQFTQLMTSMQSTFSGSFAQICAPFSRLGSSFQSFFQSASSSGLSLNTIIPQPLPDLLQHVIPGFGTALSGLGFK